MATRESVDECIHHCQDVINIAQDQYKEASLQEHINDEGYTESQLKLEQAYIELEKLKDSANAQQKEDLDRVRVQLQEMQNKMILLRH
ncbi:YtzC family protein [Jeotgalibacillus marinus]|uniref:YtzC family protein n=1 Tax=Jeotgalibacillus marinus TaxID=86667 RepID=A0ABV3Q6K0_9BACL